MTSRWDAARRFGLRLLKFVALITVTGGLGVVLGLGLTKLATGDDVPAPVASGATQTQTAATTVTTSTATTPVPTTSIATTPTATTTVRTTPSANTPAGALEQVQVAVLGAILRPAGTPEGQQRHRSRLTMRVRAVNAANTAVTITRPVLAVGSVRLHPDGAARTATTEFGQLAAGETRAVTLRFELAGDATDKLTIDRRARLVVAGRSLAFRLRVGSPVRP